MNIIRRETGGAEDRGLRRSDRASVPAASLAAAAECGLLFVPVHLIAVDSVRVSGGPFASFPLFAALFVAAVTVSTALRRHSAMRAAVPVAAIALGLAQGSVWGTAGASGTGTAVVLALAVALRVVMLAIRDWREPIADSFVLGTAVLFVEVVAVDRRDPVHPIIPAVVVLFFLGSLASRAASVWLANRPAQVGPGSSLARPHRSLIVVLGTLGAVMALALALGGPHGAFEVSGGFVYGLLAKVILAMGWVVAELLLRPLYWLLTKAHVSAEGISRAAARIRAIRPATTGKGGGPSLVERVIGLLLFAGMFLLLLTTIRRRWSLLSEAGARRPGEPTPDRASILSRRARKRTPRLRRELPADMVRRWYAEALLTLERLGLAKPPSRTPGEYLSDVTRAFPDCAPGFTALTRAYEDVRYGSVRMEPAALGRLDAARGLAMDALSRARRMDDPDQA